MYGLGLYGGATWHPDGDALGLTANPGDLWIVRLDGSGASQLAQTPFIEGTPAFSPDGNWVAYTANEEARYQIYVAPYPGPGRRVLVSTTGGTEPRWSRDGRELFYRSGGDLMAVAFDPRQTPPVGSPERLFETSSPAGVWTIPNYDVAPDGRFVMLVAEGRAEIPKLVTMLNWFAELRDPAPAR